ncbi:hypothetical protein H8356DRAFT_1385490 [Neocallimastix lanati (nom. inval.)]|nr:hypothetical protein H8356DRAFT_1385490 [Neocallimastix sp. JGI-2020a]
MGYICPEYKAIKSLFTRNINKILPPDVTTFDETPDESKYFYEIQKSKFNNLPIPIPSKLFMKCNKEQATCEILFEEMKKNAYYSNNTIITSKNFLCDFEKGISNVIGSGERRRFINNIFQSPSNESSFPISYFVGLAEFLTNVMPIVIGDFYTMIDLYSVRPTVVKSVDVVTIRQRRNSDTDSNDNFHPHGVIFDEWEELEAISSSNLIT